MTEAELQEAVRRMCADLGLYHYHPHDSRRSTAGWPDSVIIGRAGIIFRELKTQSGQLSSEQKQVGYLLQGCGLSWEVWRPADLYDGTIGTRLAALAGHRVRIEPGPCAGPGCDHVSHRRTG